MNERTGIHGHEPHRRDGRVDDNSLNTQTGRDRQLRELESGSMLEVFVRERLGDRRQRRNGATNFVNEHSEALEDNERLEFLGDAVLDFLSGAWLERMEQRLKRADSRLHPVDFAAISVFLAGLGFVAPYLFLGGALGLLLGLVAAGVAFLAPQFWLNQRREGRRKKLEEQLPEALTLISNSLKAGFGLLQSLSQASERLDHPIATELALTIHEMNIGASPDKALLSLSERAASYDLDLAVTAMLVQRSVGGNLSEILDTVAATMRERIRIRGEIKTLTAQQQLTGLVIGALPIGVGGLFLVISPDYITLLFTETAGKVMLGIAVVLEAVGIMVIRRILDIEV